MYRLYLLFQFWALTRTVTVLLISPCFTTVPKSSWPDPESRTTPEMAGARMFQRLLIKLYVASINSAYCVKYRNEISHEILSLLDFLLRLFDQHFLLLLFLLYDGTRHYWPAFSLFALGWALCLLFQCLFLLFLLVLLFLVLSLLADAPFFLLFYDSGCFFLAQS